ncbi:Dabb family protein [Aspergillus candidus]|uniref:Stress responsive A/B barrel domain protein n=1 Tax=Aspergillus candidus TaxID=41067 RepID=A0A2I2F4X6_ASPCN|nr:stress responsive A/B barrel domain protein [Aspergillus candidus]PLB35691.1 stress responsive A/B barrel domain protein [Aspergillus candidus]
MPIYHIVLFRLKPNVTPTQLTTWSQTAQNMVGQIPGLRSLKANTPLPICVPRAKGFNMGLVAVLEEAKDVEVYAGHPAHQEVQRMREELCEETLAYDLEFEE